MKIISIHNFYQLGGGEDHVFENEAEILSRSNDVYKIEFRNDGIDGFCRKILTSISVLLNKSSYNYFKEIEKSGCDIAHIHNFFPLINPVFFTKCQNQNLPVVHTLHNFRTLCPTATLMYDGEICERSLYSSSWWTIPKRVYRNSLLGTAVLAYMVEYHKFRGTWQSDVDHFIALTEFAKNKFIEGGFPKNKISVKPNFIEDKHDGNHKISKQGGYVLFVGRLSEEKGLRVLIDAWQSIQYPLKIIGDGPLREYIETAVTSNHLIEFLGFREKADIFPLIQNADCLIMPSIWYEGFPMTLLEAFSNGTPALVSNIGSMAEIVTDGVTGMHFEVGNLESLAEKADYLIRNRNFAKTMGINARMEYLSKYTPEINLEILMDIYHKTIRKKKGVTPF